MNLKFHLETLNLSWLTMSLIVKKTYIIIEYIRNVGNTHQRLLLKTCVFIVCVFFKNVVILYIIQCYILHTSHFFQILVTYNIKRVDTV